jgi:beta-galactosidase
MEQQPGPVNWAHWNPIPKDGMVRLWSWQAFAHGCELVSYFRWRQTPYAQEQMHAGLLAPDDSLAQGALEVAQLSQEIKDIQNQNQVQNWQASSAKVALLFDYDSMWMSEISPQGKDFLGIEQVFRIYSALRSLALDVDIISTQTDLVGSQYQLIVLPAQWHVSEALKIQLEQIAAKNIPIVLAPRVGSKTEYLSISEPLAPGPLSTLAGLKVKRVSSLPPGIQTEILTQHNKPTEKHQVSRWLEDVECLSAKPYWTSVKNQTVVAKNIATYYVASWLMQESWKALFSELCANHQIDFENLPEGIRVSRMSASGITKDDKQATSSAVQNYQMVVNYSDQAHLWQPAEANSELLLGSAKVQAQQVSIWKVL